MTTICRFVDSIAAAPTVRFDCNDGIGATLLLRGTSIGTPQLNQAYSPSLLVDGGVVGSSAYGLRPINLLILFTFPDVEDANTAIAALLRELDRDSNLLMWQDAGAGHPVFFETIRTQPDAVDISNAGVGIWEIQVALQAKPFALGLRQTLGPYTVNNDPAAASNGLFFDVTGVLGDVPVPAVIEDDSGLRGFLLLAARQHGTPADHTFFLQAESATLGGDLTNPGGGPDAAMSGTGTNNFVRTAFAGTAGNFGPTWDLSTTHNTTAKKLALAGTYRLIAVVRRSDITSVITIQGTVAGVAGKVLTLPLTTDRMMVDLGVFTYQDLVTPGHSVPAPADAASTVAVNAARTSGTGTLDYDFFALIPADEQTLMWSNALATITSDVLIDSVNERILLYPDGGNPFDGTAPMRSRDAVNASGSFPLLVPGQTNRFYVLTSSYSGGSVGAGQLTLAMDKTTSEVLTVHYWPRYLHVRPVAS